MRGGWYWFLALIAMVALGAHARAAPAEAVVPPPPGKPIAAIKPNTPAEAALLSLSPLAATHQMQIQLQYDHIPGDGHSGAVFLRTDLWMPYVFFPGIEAPNMGSIILLDLRFQTLHQPGVSQTGVNDIRLFDLPACQFSWGGIALGPVIIFPAATSPMLGQGKLQIGPVALLGISKLPKFLFTFALGNLFSVAGAPDRPDIDTLVASPIIGYLLPKAFYLRTDPIWTFDWTRHGFATIPVNLSFGHAFTRFLTAEIEPEWVTTGDLKNTFTLRLFLSYLGW
jgi:hypothetical protein